MYPINKQKALSPADLLLIVSHDQLKESLAVRLVYDLFNFHQETQTSHLHDLASLPNLQQLQVVRLFNIAV
jgi:hypothetical protein